MCKVILREKETNDTVFSKQFADKEKAESLKNIIEKYLDNNKAEVILEKKEKEHYCSKKIQKESNHD